MSGGGALSAPGALGAHHPELRRLRTLLRDASTRRSEGACVVEGPRVLDAALARDARVECVYVGIDARDDARAAAERARSCGVAVREVASGVIGRISDVRTSSGVLALVTHSRATPAALDAGDVWLVATQVGDPGNLGTLVRAAEAAGAAGFGVGTGSVDPYNPKAVRASAGGVFGIPVVEDDVVAMLDRLGARGVTRLGAAAHDGVPLADAPLGGAAVAIVLGHETRGLGDVPLDGRVTIPLAGHAESLNVAMAGTVLLFDAARRRGSGGR